MSQRWRRCLKADLCHFLSQFSYSAEEKCVPDMKEQRWRVRRNCLEKVNAQKYGTPKGTECGLKCHIAQNVTCHIAPKVASHVTQCGRTCHLEQNVK